MTLPGEPSHFEKSLRLGLGRAILRARHEDVSEHRELILAACLHCWSYSQPEEDIRAQYGYDLLQCLPDREWYAARLREVLNDEADSWDVAQRFALATLLAKDDEERAALERAADAHPSLARFRETEAIMSTDPALTVAPRRPTEEDRRRAADRLPAMQDPKEIAACLRLFITKPFPGEAATILSFLTHPDARVSHAAIAVLRQFHDPRVRALAFDPNYRADAAHLLIRNYEPGDEAMLLAWIQQETDLATLHDLGMGAQRFFEEHPHPELEVPLLFHLYENGPCGFCRWSTVRRLIQHGALPADLRAECAWDSYDETRLLVAV